MKLLMRVNMQEEGGSTFYAAIELDEVEVAALKKMRGNFKAAKKRDKKLWEMYSWGWGATYYEEPSLDVFKTVGPTDLAELESFGVIKLDDAEDLEQLEEARTDCHQLVTREGGFCFFAYEKYSSTPLLTEEVPDWLVFGRRRPKNR